PVEELRWRLGGPGAGNRRSLAHVPSLEEATMTGRASALVVLLLASLGGACASPSMHMAPEVRDTDLRGDANDLEAHVVVAWRGLQERDGVTDLRFRVRVDNPGPTSF